MGMVIQNGADVVTFLKSQHQQIKGLMTSVLATQGDERAKAFYSLRRMLAFHETAEEEIVHPAAKKYLPDGESIVRMRLKEENEAKKALTVLEALDINSEVFETKFRALQKDVLGHAESEETQEFDALSAKLEPKQLSSMRKAVEFAESMAPSRPHAGMESAAANIIAGPFVAMLDRVHDALASKTRH